MKLVLILSALAASAFGFSYKMCGGDSGVVKLNSLKVTPDPLSFPGNVQYEIDVDIKQKLSDVSMDLSLTRNTLLDIRLPCAKQIGSCKYTKMCSFLDDMNRENWGNIGSKIAGPILAKTPNRPDLCATGLGPIKLKQSGAIAVPELPSLLSFIAEGDYTLRAEVKDNSKNKVIACIEVKVELKKKGSGKSIWDSIFG